MLGATGTQATLKVAALIPAYQAAPTIVGVVSDLLALSEGHSQSLRVLVVDDGSTDGTADLAMQAGAQVLQHGCNLGKGTALRSGFRVFGRTGFRCGGHLGCRCATPGRRGFTDRPVACTPGPPNPGHQGLARDGAPRSSRFSNAVSNDFLSAFAHTSLKDTQCGLRRYPLTQTLALQATSPGYAFEAEVILRAAHAHWTIEQIPIAAYYPAAHERVSHFHVVRDPLRIVLRALGTWVELDGS